MARGLGSFTQDNPYYNTGSFDASRAFEDAGENIPEIVVTGKRPERDTGGMANLSQIGLPNVGGPAEQFPTNLYGKEAIEFADPSVKFNWDDIQDTAKTQTGIFGGTLGPQIKNSALGKILIGALQINPGTAGLMSAISLIQGLKNTNDPAAYLKQGFMKMAMQKVAGNLGLSGLQRSALGNTLGAVRGDQSLPQAFQNFASSAAYQKMAPSIYKRAYNEGGMPAVYLAASALRQGMQGIQGKINQRPSPDG